MKKRMICLMTGAVVMLSSMGVFAAQDWIPYDINGQTIDYSTYTGAVKKNGISAKGSDTTPAASEKLYDLKIPGEIDGTKITSVEKNGFYDDNALRKLELSPNTEKIGDKAFTGADNLIAIELPDSVTEIGAEAFGSCDNVEKIKLSSKLKVIPQYAFRGCKSVKTVTIPASVTTIGNSAFDGCKALSSITFKGDIEEIADGAFKNTGLTDITLPDGITLVSTNLFEGCSSLETAKVPDGVKTIGNAAFKDCKNLKQVYIPDSCKTIADSAFTGCKNVVIYCSKNSFAQSFAEDQGIKYEFGGYKKTPAVQQADPRDPSSISVVVDGNVLDCGAAQPVIINGRTLVPLRPIFEALGVDLDWNGTTKTITGTKGTTNIKLSVGDTNASLNGKNIKLDVPAQIIDGHTMVPLRFIGDCLGCEIKWSQQTKTATINS